MFRTDKPKGKKLQMNKQRNRRNWLIVMLIVAVGLFFSPNGSGWPATLLVLAVVALVSYMVLARLRVL